MSRLTTRDHKSYNLFTSDSGCAECQTKCCCQFDVKVCDKLATFEDAVEDGSFFIPPAQIGGTVYTIEENEIVPWILINYEIMHSIRVTLSEISCNFIVKRKLENVFFTYDDARNEINKRKLNIGNIEEKNINKYINNE